MALTAAGKSMPIDAVPSSAPTNLQAWRSSWNTVQCRPVSDLSPYDPDTAHYAVSHFATCPNADAHRRRK